MFTYLVVVIKGHTMLLLLAPDYLVQVLRKRPLYMFFTKHIPRNLMLQVLHPPNHRRRWPTWSTYRSGNRTDEHCPAILRPRYHLLDDPMRCHCLTSRLSVLRFECMIRWTRMKDSCRRSGTSLGKGCRLRRRMLMLARRKRAHHRRLEL